MKITKYLILGLLVISVTKKMYLSDNGHPLPFKLALSQKDAQTSTNSIKEPDLSSPGQLIKENTCVPEVTAIF